MPDEPNRRLWVGILERLDQRLAVGRAVVPRKCRRSADHQRQCQAETKYSRQGPHRSNLQTVERSRAVAELLRRNTHFVEQSQMQICERRFDTGQAYEPATFDATGGAASDDDGKIALAMDGGIAEIG